MIQKEHLFSAAVTGMKCANIHLDSTSPEGYGWDICENVMTVEAV